MSATSISVLIAVELWCVVLMNLKKIFSISNWMRGFPLSYFTYSQTNSYLHTIFNVFWQFLSWRNGGIHEMLLLYLLLSYFPLFFVDMGSSDSFSNANLDLTAWKILDIQCVNSRLLGSIYYFFLQDSLHVYTVLWLVILPFRNSVVWIWN